MLRQLYSFIQCLQTEVFLCKRAHHGMWEIGNICKLILRNKFRNFLSLKSFLDNLNYNCSQKHTQAFISHFMHWQFCDFWGEHQKSGLLSIQKPMALESCYRHGRSRWWWVLGCMTYMEMIQRTTQILCYSFFIMVY